MLQCVFVGLGGFVGAVCRYLVGRIPFPCPGFPVATLCVNFFGSLLIGFIAFLFAAIPGSSRNLQLFLQAGVCGGFTTFSAFALESSNLFQAGKTGSAILYIALSLILCLLGVVLGRMLAQKLGTAA